MIENSKLSWHKIKKIIQSFCIDIPASKIGFIAQFKSQYNQLLIYVVEESDLEGLKILTQSQHH